jgi:hypothetical protein
MKVSVTRLKLDINTHIIINYEKITLAILLKLFAIILKAPPGNPI